MQGCENLYHFVKTALAVRTDADLDLAAHYFAGAVVKIGVIALIAFLLKKPLGNFQKAGSLKSFRTMNYRPIPLQAINSPPLPGTVPVIQFGQLGSRTAGITDEYGYITINQDLPNATRIRETINHEMVHRFFSAKFGPFQQLRAQLAINVYLRSAILRSSRHPVVLSPVI